MARFRSIKKSDNPELAKIIRDSLKEYGANKPGTVYFDPTTDDLFSLFSHEGSFYLVVEAEDGEVLGGGGLYPSDGLAEGVVELVKMYLKPKARNKGLGRQLLDKNIDAARKLGYQTIYLESLPELKEAIRLYTKYGFKPLTKAMGNTGHHGCDVWMIFDLI